MWDSAFSSPFQERDGMHPRDLRGFGSGEEKVCCGVGEWGVDLSGSPALRRRALQHRQRVDTRFFH